MYVCMYIVLLLSSQFLLLFPDLRLTDFRLHSLPYQCVLAFCCIVSLLHRTLLSCFHDLPPLLLPLLYGLPILSCLYQYYVLPLCLLTGILACNLHRSLSDFAFNNFLLCF